MVGEWAPVADDGADRAPPTPPFDNPERQEGACAPSLVGSEKPFMVMVSSTIPDLHLVGAGAGTQCFPFYVYDEDGSNRRENITDWALAQFRARYGEPSSQTLLPQGEGLNVPRLGEEGLYSPRAEGEGSGVRVADSPRAEGEGLGVRVDAVFRARASEAITQIAKELRKRQTPAEITLWE